MELSLQWPDRLDRSIVHPSDKCNTMEAEASEVWHVTSKRSSAITGHLTTLPEPRDKSQLAIWTKSSQCLCAIR